MSKKQVLIVDDSMSMRELVRYTLDEAGYDVTQASNGQDALTKLSNNGTFSLIITDLNMPLMNGIELLRQIRAGGDHTTVPVLLLTTENNPELKTQAKAAGATGWLVKPFVAEKLLKTIARVMP